MCSYIEVLGFGMVGCETTFVRETRVRLVGY